MESEGSFSESSLKETFFNTCERCKSSAHCAEASNEDRLRLYGLFKQVV